MDVEDDVFGVFFFEEFPGGSDGKESACNVGEPGGGNGNPLQYSCLENPVDRGAWWATVHNVTKSWIRLSNLTFL